MPKKIVILLDGTSNEIKADRSNILRLYGTLQKSDEQLVYYDPGVGTFGAEQAWSRLTRKGIEVWGMATGWGLDANVKEAYRFLVENYEKSEKGARDQIHIFGFSRGAYSARVLAGFIHAFGLLEKRNLNLLDYVYRAYKRIGEDGNEDSFAEMRLQERVLRPDRPSIRCLGLFDTVSSVIESGGVLPRLRKHAFTATNPSVEAVRHAVAISERRTMFRPQLWPLGQSFSQNRFSANDALPQDAKEVWFTGSHGDVGGGYPEATSALAKIPLHWMIEQTSKFGLEFKTRTVNEIVLGKREGKPYIAPDPKAPINDSMGLGWQFLEYLPRKAPEGTIRQSVLGWTIPGSEPRVIPEGARIHASVLARDDVPENLPDSYQQEIS